MDNFAITVTSNSAKSNCKKLERIALELISKAREAAISFDVSKTELIHFYSKRTKSFTIYATLPKVAPYSKTYAYPSYHQKQSIFQLLRLNSYCLAS